MHTYVVAIYLLLLFNRINNVTVVDVELGQTTYCQMQRASDSFAHVNILAEYRNGSRISEGVPFHTGK